MTKLTDEEEKNTSKNHEMYSNFFEKLAAPEEYRNGLFIAVKGELRKLSQVPKGKVLPFLRKFILKGKMSLCPYQSARAGMTWIST